MPDRRWPEGPLLRGLLINIPGSCWKAPYSIDSSPPAAEEELWLVKSLSAVPIKRILTNPRKFAFEANSAKGALMRWTLATMWRRQCPATVSLQKYLSFLPQRGLEYFIIPLLPSWLNLICYSKSQLSSFFLPTMKGYFEGIRNVMTSTSQMQMYVSKLKLFSR